MIRARLFQLYVRVVIALGLAGVGYFGAQIRVEPHLIAVTLILILSIALYDIYASTIPEFRSQISASVSLVVAGLLVLGPPLGVVAAAAGTLLSELALRGKELTAGPRRQILPVIGFNVGQVALSLAVLSFVLEAAGHTPGQLLTPGDFGFALAAFAAHVVFNTSLVLGVVSLQTRQWLRHLARDWYREFAPQYLVLGASTLLLTVLYFITPFHALLGLIPLALVHYSFRSYLRIREEAQKTFEKVVQLLEQRDPYTGEHSSDVAELAAEIAQDLGMHGADLEMIRSVARVHDIGKIAVPDKILLKPGKLEPEEWEIMKRHAEIGADLLQGLAIYDRYAHVVRHEHEHWNGNGYPDGLRGERIPVASRIISAADVYHALISDRPYRPAYEQEEALDIIRKMSGRQLDPRVVGALLRVLERKGLEAESSQEEGDQAA